MARMRGRATRMQVHEAVSRFWEAREQMDEHDRFCNMLSVCCMDSFERALDNFRTKKASNRSVLFSIESQIETIEKHFLN
jgi:Zn-dependent M32 family carboxypeptidase